MKRYDLPEWLDELLPETRQPTELFLDGDMVCTRSPDGRVTKLCEGIEEAYDLVNGDDIDIVFSDDVWRKFGDDQWELLGSISVPAEDGYGYRMLMSHTDDDRLSLLEWGWKDSQKAYQDWVDDKDEFYKSYLMVDRHPAFWTRGCLFNPSDERWTDDMLWSWDTTGYMQKVSVMPGYYGDRLLIALEGGGHVPDSDSIGHEPAHANVLGVYMEHYHDLRLDAFCETYEQAIVEFARLVDKFFAPDGTEREDIAYEKTELEKTLEERVREMEEATGRSWKAWHDSLPVVRFADYGRWARSA